MSFQKVFEVVDKIVGDVTIFKGLTFALDEGILTVDVFLDNADDRMYICEFTPYNALEPLAFAAKGEVELKEQINAHIRQ